jgi:hypothetical protein
MKIDAKKFPILDSKITDLAKDVKWRAATFLKKHQYMGAYNEIFAAFKKSGAFKNVEYVTETVRKTFDDDPKVANTLWKMRDNVPTKDGILLIGDGLTYVYSVLNKDGKVAFMVMTFYGELFMNCSVGRWNYDSGTQVGLAALQFDNQEEDCQENYNITYPIQMVSTFLLFKEYAEPQIKYTHGKNARELNVNKKQYINGFPMKIAVVIDSTYFQTVIKTDGFGVKGHLRFQLKNG